MDRDAEGVDSYLSYALAAAHRSVHQGLARALKDEGVQVEAWRIMEAIDAEETITMGRLADRVLLAPPTLTKMVDRMVADGLVQRQVAMADQRQVHLVLSAMGAHKRDRLRHLARRQDAELLALLGTDVAARLHHALAVLADRQQAPEPVTDAPVAARLM